jgi:hypothetical protein
MPAVALKKATDEPTISFACDVIIELQGIARELSKESGTKTFCSLFSAALENVQDYLTLDDSPRNVSKLLDNLERLCQVRKSIFNTSHTDIS